MNEHYLEHETEKLLLSNKRHHMTELKNEHAEIQEIESDAVNHISEDLKEVAKYCFDQMRYDPTTETLPSKFSMTDQLSSLRHTSLQNSRCKGKMNLLSPETMMQNRRNRDLCETTMSICTVDATIIQCKTIQSNGRATINEPSKLQYKHPASAESRGNLNASLMDNATAMASRDTNVLNTRNVSESKTQQNQETRINNKLPRQPKTRHQAEVQQ